MKQSVDAVFGRTAEIKLLTHLISEAGKRKGAVCFVSGESGLGKSTLVESVLGNHGSSIQVLSTQSIPEWTTAYGTVLNILRSAFDQRGRKKRPYVTQALKLLSQDKTKTQPRRPQTADDMMRILADAIWEACEDQDTVIYLDDLQWADESSLELLPLLATELANRRVLLIATCRDEDLPRNHPLRRIRTRIRRLNNCHELDLKPLSLPETTKLIEQILDEAPSRNLAREIHERTGGLPLFVEQFSQSLQSGQYLLRSSKGLSLSPGITIPVPESVRDTIDLQTQQLSKESLDALEVGAILGVRFPLDLALKMGASESALDELFEKKFLIEGEAGTAAFRHSMTRDIIREEIPWSRRRRLHGSAGDLLRRNNCAGSERGVAEHYSNAGRQSDARMAFLKVAEMACAVHAFRDASQAFERALEFWANDEAEKERLDCMERLADCALLGGYTKESARVWRDIVLSDAIKSDPARHALAYRVLASVYDLAGNGPQAIDARKQAVQLFIKAENLADAAGESLRLAGILIVSYQLTEGKGHAEKALRLARKCGDHELESLSLSEVGLALAMQGKEAAARRRIEAGLEIAIQHNLKDAAATAYKQLPYASAYRGDYAGQRNSFETAIQFCSREGLNEAQHSCFGCMAYALFRLGEWKKSADACREVIEAEGADESARIIAKGGLGLVLTLRGQIKHGRKYLQEANEGAERQGITPINLIARPGLALIDSITNANAAAESRFRDLLTFWETTEDSFDVLFGICLAAGFFAKRKLTSELGACTAAVQRIAALNANPESLGSLAYVLGEAALLDGRPEEAAGQFVQSLHQFERIHARYEMARNDYRIGEAFLASNAKDTAIDHLKKGYAAAKALGARPLQDEIRALLSSIDVSAEEPRLADSPERAAKAGLTRRQNEVASFIAEGMTNKEVAAKLNLSPRTVDMHVGHLLDRLDCSTRSEAVKKLIDLGILD